MSMTVSLLTDIVDLRDMNRGVRQEMRHHDLRRCGGEWLTGGCLVSLEPRTDNSAVAAHDCICGGEPSADPAPLGQRPQSTPGIACGGELLPKVDRRRFDHAPPVVRS